MFLVTLGNIVTMKAARSVRLRLLEVILALMVGIPLTGSVLGAPGKPSAPSILSAIAVSTNQIRLSWKDNSSNELRFYIDRSTNSFSQVTQFITSSNVTSYFDTNLLPATTYSYRVRAWNNSSYSSYSNTTNATTLVVLAITSQPQSRSVSLGANATFSVTAAGNPAPGYQWQFNGLAVTGATSSALTLANVQLANSGNYSVVVTNAYGSVTSSVAVLTVLLPLVITSQPQALTNQVGTTATFSASASGSAPLAYRWRLNGVSLTNGGRFSGVFTNFLTIMNVQTTEAGGYALVVSNAVGMVTSAVATLMVVAPPVISTPPTSQSVPVGGTVNFTVGASGASPLSYQWRFGSAPVAGATSSVFSITNVQSTSAGNYSVLVTNVYGSVTSSVAALTVTLGGDCLSAPSGLVGWWPGDGNANDISGADNGTLKGNATAGAAGMVGSAFKFDGTNAYVQITDASALRPTNLTVEAWVNFSGLDSATLGTAPAGDQYIVFKQNSLSYNFEGYSLEKYRLSKGDVFMFTIGSASGQEIMLVSQTVVKTSVWYHVAAVRGSNYLQLYVNGQPEAQTNVSFAQNYGTLPLYFGTSGQTYWDGKFKGSLDEVSLYNRALSSNEVAAIYAAGSAGKCKVASGLTITAQPQSQTVSGGSGVSFAVTATGTAPMGYQWRYNGAKLAGASGTSLTLSGVQLANAGNYDVVLTNSTASVNSTVAVLTVVPAAGTLMVDGSKTYQIIDGFGVNANHRSWNNSELQPVLDALIDQAGMTLFHVIFDNNNWETTNDNSDPNLMNWAYYNTVYSSSEFQMLWDTMAYLNQRGISNGLVASFEGPAPLWMGGLYLTPGYENEYAETIASALVYARTVQGLQFTRVEPVNEPDNTYAGIHLTDANQFVSVMHNLAQQLDNNGLSDTSFAGPDLAYTSTDWLSASMTDPVVMAKMDHFGLHSYQGLSPDASGVYDFLLQLPYPDRHFWMTEYNVWCSRCQSGTSGDDTWTFARGTASFLLNHLANGASAALVWEGYDSEYTDFDPTTGLNNPPHWSFWGLFAVDDINAAAKTYTPRKGFYTVAQVSKFVRPGAQRIDVGSANTPLTLLAFYNSNSGQFTLTGINTNSTASTLSCALANLPAISGLDFYYTSSSNNLFHAGSVGVTNGAFSVSIAADCVFTLSH
jgi:hypothetical protein